MTAVLPPTTYLHVWFARRPLVASRAAILASLLNADADRAAVSCIPSESMVTRLQRVENMRVATQQGERLGLRPTGIHGRCASLLQPQALRATVLDPTAGGGSIPFEAVRLGCETFANDLNPVAALLLKTTVELPLQVRLRPFSARYEDSRRILSDAYSHTSQVCSRRAEWRPVCDGLPLGSNRDMPVLWRAGATLAQLEALGFGARSAAGSRERPSAI